jgi:hypothetical protein
MNGLSLNFQGETRIFGPDGKVSILVDGQPVTKGAWRAQAQGPDPKDNKIRYDFNGQQQVPVPVKYRFNQQNQLEAIIPAAANGGSDSAAFAFLGSIQADDTQDVVYQLINADGTSMQRSLTVYGNLHIDPAKHNLVIDLTDGGTAEIKGDNALQSLEALKKDITPFKSADLLSFRASTTNVLSNGQTKKVAADIKFVGNWDFNGNQLVFLSHISGDLTKPTIELGFAGKFKAVSVGLAYFADAEQTQLAFNISGQHQWNTAKASWDVSLGFAKKQFTAKVSGNVSIARPTGVDRGLTLNADWTIQHANGTTSMQMSLDASYQFSANNMLSVQASFQKAGQTITYDLKVEGKFVYKAGTLTFQVRYTNTDPDNKFSFQIAFQANPTSLIKALSIVLNISENEVKIDFQFELRMTWVDGKLQKSEPKPLNP